MQDEFWFLDAIGKETFFPTMNVAIMFGSFIIEYQDSVYCGNNTNEKKGNSQGLWQMNSGMVVQHCG